MKGFGKKILSWILVLSMMLSLSVVVFAEGEEAETAGLDMTAQEGEVSIEENSIGSLTGGQDEFPPDNGNYQDLSNLQGEVPADSTSPVDDTNEDYVEQTPVQIPEQTSETAEHDQSVENNSGLDQQEVTAFPPIVESNTEEHITENAAPNEELQYDEAEQVIEDIDLEDTASQEASDSPVIPGTIAISQVDASAKGVVLGNGITFNAKVVSTAPYQLYYRLYDAASNVVSEGWMQNNSITVYPKAVGDYRLQAIGWNKDISAWQSDATSNVVKVVASAFSVTGVNVNATSVSLGNNIVFMPQVSGGSGSVIYTYYVYKDGVQVTTETTTSAGGYSYTPTETGTYYCSVAVKDTVFDITYTRKSGNVTVTDVLKIDSITPTSLLITTGFSIQIAVAASGGVGGYTYDYHLTRGAIDVDIKTDQINSIYTMTPDYPGNYRLSVTVTDGAGNTVSSQSDIIQVVQRLQVTSVDASPTVSEVGSPINFTVNYTGVTPTKYYWEFYQNGEFVHSWEDTTGTLTTYAYTPTDPGTYTATVTAYYENGSLQLKSSGTSGAVVVENTLTVHGVSVSSNYIEQGQSVTFTVETSGGADVKEYVYEIKYAGVTEKVFSSNESSYSYVPKNLGVYWCEVKVKNIGGSYLSATSGNVTVVQAITFDQVNVSSTAIPLGAYVTFTPVVSGGSGTYRYIYCVFDSRKQLTMYDTTDPFFNYTPTAAGTYYCVVYASDATGVWHSVRSENVSAFNSVSSVTAVVENLAAPSLWATYIHQPVKITPSVIGTPLLYCFRVYDGSSNLIAESFAGSSYSFTPTAVGHYTIDLLVYDGISWKAAPTIHFDAYERVNFSHVNLSTLAAGVSDTLYMAPVISGGIPNLQFIYCVYDQNSQLTMDSTTSTNWSYTFTHPGTYHVSIYATDGTGVWLVRTSPQITVTSTTPVSITDISVSHTYASVSDTLYYNVTYTGTPSTFIYCIFRNGTQLTMTYSSSPTFSYVPDSPGNYQITVYAEAGGTWVYKTADTITYVNASGILTINSVTPDSTTYKVNDTMNFATVVTGNVGAPSYIHCIFRDGVQLTMDSSTSSAYSYVPTAAGQYRLDEYVTDSRGGWVKASSITVTVTPLPPVGVNVTTSATTLAVNQYVTVYAAGTGGTGSYEYIYCLFKDSTQLTMDTTTATSYTYLLTAPGTYHIDVYCHDSLGTWTMKPSATITVS